jgi:RNA recognition motif-containing protein
MPMRLFAGNLALPVTQEDLGNLFDQAGQVEFAFVVNKPDMGRSQGDGYVELASPMAGAAAIERFDGQERWGNKRKVDEAEPPLGRPVNRFAQGQRTAS